MEMLGTTIGKHVTSNHIEMNTFTIIYICVWDKIIKEYEFLNVRVGGGK